MADADEQAAERLKRVLELLERPSSRLVAGTPDGRPVVVPESVPVERSRCGTTHVFDTLDPGDYDVIIGALETSKTCGYAQGVLHFQVPDPEPVTIHLFELCESIGVSLAVLTVEDPDSTFVERLCQRDIAPHYARMTQDPYGMILAVDDDLERMLGFRSGELIGHRSSEFIHPDDMALAGARWRDSQENPTQPPLLHRMRFRNGAGQYAWFNVAVSNHATAGVMVTSFADASAEVEVQRRMEEREQLLHQITESLPLGVVQIDAQGEVRHANSRLAVVLGFEIEKSIAEVIEHIDPVNRPAFENALDRVMGGENVDVQLLVTPPRDRARVCMVNLRRLSGAEADDGALVCFTEVTEAVKLQQQLEQQASHDSLTGCMNRSAILKFLAAQLEREGSRPEGIAAVFIDLDLFKNANDRHGHAAGDEILTAVGGRLRNMLRQGDAVGRIGGDEFLVIFRDVATVNEAQRIGDRIAAQLAGDIQLAVGAVPISASVGVSWSADGRIGTEELVAQADAAMYAAKRAGGRTAVLHHPPRCA